MTRIESFEIENPSETPKRRLSNFYDDNEDDDSSINPDYHPNDINNPGKKEQKTDLKNQNNFLRFKGDNEFYGIVNLLASTIGCGCFTFPSLIEATGIVTALLILIIVSISIYFSLYLLNNFIISTKLFSLAEITQKILGKKWLKIYAFSAVIFYLSMEINYINLIVEYGAKMLFSIEKNYFKILYYIISCIIEIVLCLFTSKISHMHILSLISVICFTVIVVSLLVYSFAYEMNEETKNKFSSDKLFIFSDSVLKSIINIFTCFIEYIYSYSCHCSFPTLIGNLKTKEEKTKKVINIFFAIIVIFYILIAIFGYICQINNEENKKALILFSNGSLHGFYSYLLQIIILLFFVCLIPIRFLVIRDNYQILFSFKFSYYIELIFISVIIILANIISYFCSNDTNIIFSLNEIFGGVFGVAICFDLPVITHISINSKSEIKSIFGYIMAIGFLIIGLFTAGYSFCEKILKII